MPGGKCMSPCGALFGFLKKHGHIKHAEAASLLLSGKPLADGKSALSRAEEPTWLSRFIVNAPQETLQPAYFADPAISVPRVISAMKRNGKHPCSSADILSLLDEYGKSDIANSLEPYGQAKRLFENSYTRIRRAQGLSENERLEASLFLIVSAAISGNVRQAVLRTLEYCRTSWGGITALTPDAGFLPMGEARDKASIAPLGLLKTDGGYSSGTTYWVDPTPEGSVIGSMALNESDISDVGPCVSAQHARIWRAPDGSWYVEDLDSTNGTEILRGTDRYVVASSVSAVEASVGNCIELMPGDQLRLAGDTCFVVVAANPAMA